MAAIIWRPARQALPSFPEDWQRAREAIQASTRKEKRGGQPDISKQDRTAGRSAMGLAIALSADCAIDGGLAHIVLNQPERGNPIDGDFAASSALHGRIE
jgi:hypothetical protein